MTKRFLSEQEVAEELGISVQTARKWRSIRRGPPFVKFGSRVAYPREDLEQWIAAQPRFDGDAPPKEEDKPT